MKKIDDKICLHPVGLLYTFSRTILEKTKISLDEYNIESWPIHWFIENMELWERETKQNHSLRLIRHLNKKIEDWNYMDQKLTSGSKSPFNSSSSSGDRDSRSLSMSSRSISGTSWTGLSCGVSMVTPSCKTYTGPLAWVSG